MGSPAIGQVSLVAKSGPAEVNRWALEVDSRLLCLLKPKEGHRLAQGPTARGGGHQMGSVDTWNPWLGLGAVTKACFEFFFSKQLFVGRPQVFLTPYSSDKV